MNIRSLEVNELIGLYNEKNNAGEGFDPSDDISSGRLELVIEAGSTSEVSVYKNVFGDVILVGTDGSGSEGSRWAVELN